jgi:hypothetical protein
LDSDTSKPEQTQSAAAGSPAPSGLLPSNPPPLESDRGIQPNPSDLLNQRHSQTARTLAFWLLILLGGTVILQYVCVMVLILRWRDDGVKYLEDFYHSWLPVLSGLAGSAVTYYFTRDRR